MPQLPPDTFRGARAQPIFPSTLFSCELEHAEELNRGLLRFLRKHRRAFPRWKGVDSPWQCHPDLHEQPAFEALVRAVKLAALAAAEVNELAVEDVRITGMWATWLRASEQHPPHRHANSWLSGAYWVRCDSPAPIVFHHPTPPVIQPSVTRYTVANSQSWQITAVPGQMVLFPSQLLHHVPPLPEGERVSISFNLLPTGLLLEPDSLQSARLL